MRHKWPGSCAPSLSENTFPGKGSTAMLRLMQWHSALPVLASGKQMHLISHTQDKLNQLRPLAAALPCGSEAATVPCRIPHSSSPHTEMRWVGGREGGCSLLRWQHCFSCPALLRAHLPGWSPAVAESCGSPMHCCLPQGNRGSPWDQGRRNTLGEGLTSCPQWQNRHCGGTEPHSQPKEHTSANFPQCQLYRLGCFTAVPRISSNRGLTLFCNRKDRAYDWTFIPSSLLIISPGNLNVPLISSFVELNIYTNHIYKYI